MLPTPSTSHVPFDRVYEPAEDSYLLLDTLSSDPEKLFLKSRFNLPPSSQNPNSPTSKQNPPSPLILEIGTGSGVILSFLHAHTQEIFSRPDILTLGIDVNPHACKATIQTIAIAEKDQSAKGEAHGFYLGNVMGDLTTPLKCGEIDVLIFNPPYVPTPTLPALVGREGVSAWDADSHLLELSYAGGEDGMEVTNRLIERLPGVLGRERGVAYVLLCAQNKPEIVKEEIRKWGDGWRVETVGSSGKKAGWEKLQIVRIWRESTTK